MDEKNKNKKLNYQPNIEYTEDYYANYSDVRTDKSVSIITAIEDDGSANENITNNIQDNIDSLISMIPILPVQLQTVVNQVFKPIFNEWYTDLKKKPYPSYIPENKPIVKPKDPTDNGTGNGSIEEGGGTSGGESIGDVPGITWPEPPENPELKPPHIYTPDPGNPVVPEPDLEDDEFISPGDDDDDIFEPSSPFEVTYQEIDPIDIIQKEYIKNIYDLYNYYTSRLKGVIGRFLHGLLTAYLGSDTEAQLSFIDANITLADLDGIDVNLKHIIDAAIRSENLGANKVSFCENMFPLENSLYHCKNFKVCYELRLRYAQVEIQKESDKYSSDANTILRGMKKIYDKKYDIAYINLYKYLNSSVQVLEDTFNTLLDGIKSKHTLIKKGGYDK